jgi:uncharacterized membrane protein (DUF4010 family)
VALIDTNLLGLALAVGLGLLVGMQREWLTHKRIGLRSFALISGMGGVIGLFASTDGAWILAVGFLAITIALFSHAFFVSRHEQVTGMTTELAGMAMFLIGAMATSGFMISAVVLGGGLILLLHWKSPMHALVERIGKEEFQAITRFVLITLVVLPVLPNQPFGPYGVLNPWQIWLMVVLIVSLNLAGYVAMKLFGGRGSVLIGGALGGLISSTATTVSFSTRARKDAAIVPAAAIIILIASALVYIRILIETAAVARGLLPQLVGPASIYTILFAIVIGFRVARFQPVPHDHEESSNPAELKTALSFGLLYAVVLFLSAAVNEHFGETMLYLVAIISGLTDVDAITLSTGRLFLESRITGDTAWRVIFLASVANLVFKTGVVMVVGGPELRRRAGTMLAGLSLAGLALAVFWP